MPRKKAPSARGDPPPVRADTRELFLTHGQIGPDPANPRKAFDAGELEDLAASIEAVGLLQPIAVTPRAEGEAGPEYRIVMGERRWRAWGLLIEGDVWPADHAELCLESRVEGETRRLQALIENLQRVDLSHLEISDAFEALATEHGLANKAIAEAIGRSPEYVQQHRRLARLDAETREELAEGLITFHDALEELREKPAGAKPWAPTPRQRLILAEVITAMGAGRQTEIRYDAQDGDLEQLENRDWLYVVRRNWSDQRAYVSPAWNLDSKLALAVRDAGREGLDPYYEAAGVAPPAEGEPYVTEWLNGPFPLAPEAEAELARRAATQAAEKANRDDERAAQAEAKRRMDGIEALGAMPPAVAEMLADLGIALPLKAKARAICDAEGKDLLQAHWSLQSPNADSVVRALVHVLNQAFDRFAEAGDPPPEPGPAAPTRRRKAASAAVDLDDAFGGQIRQALTQTTHPETTP